MCDKSTNRKETVTDQRMYFKGNQEEHMMDKLGEDTMLGILWKK